MSDAPKETLRLSVGLNRAEMDELRQLAYRTSNSVSSLGHLAIKHLLLQARSGAIPMLPPVTLENSEKVLNSDEIHSRSTALLNGYI